ncbi:glycosyltransferase family 2 protein, partial [Acinetobacter variabilis]|uniref:glycosyltransferase family 2 protein n=1 Tax=Acinetobacter variabilis TaxID=70346 RepID=UPI0030FA94D5
MYISIGIPFFNAEKYLEDAIKSVLAQTFQNWELILVDDGSIDRSLEIARSFNDPRIRIIADGHNRRLAYRLNQIIN